MRATIQITLVVLASLMLILLDEQCQCQSRWSHNRPLATGKAPSSSGVGLGPDVNVPAAAGHPLKPKPSSLDKLASIIDKPRPVYGAGRKRPFQSSKGKKKLPEAVVKDREETEDQSSKPFAFEFDSQDEFETRMTRQESQDTSGRITGFYSYQDANGIFRRVEYVADDDGFRAYVKTNEPGTRSSAPADVIIESSAAH